MGVDGGAEARSAGAPRGVGSREGRRSPSLLPSMGSGSYALRNFFLKINVEIAYFSAFLRAEMVSSVAASITSLLTQDNK